jgi:hypothetical protein
MFGDPPKRPPLKAMHRANPGSEKIVALQPSAAEDICGRLRIGKSFFPPAAIVGAAICSARYYNRVINSIFGSSERGACSAGVDEVSLQSWRLTYGGSWQSNWGRDAASGVGASGAITPGNGEIFRLGRWNVRSTGRGSGMSESIVVGQSFALRGSGSGQWCRIWPCGVQVRCPDRQSSRCCSPSQLFTSRRMLRRDIFCAVSATGSLQAFAPVISEGKRGAPCTDAALRAIGHGSRGDEAP